MSTHAQHGRKMAENRAKRRRFAPACAAFGALALALPLAAGPAPQALAQARSGITINNDVLNSLGPGPSPAPGAPLAPPPGYAPPSYAPAPLAPAPAAPLAPQPAPGGLTFQPYGSGDGVVTRPGTLLFPPLEAPKSTLAPGFSDNHAARAKAMNDAFAEGPEPSSQLLIPLGDTAVAGGGTPAGGGAGGNDSIVVFMENLPPAEADAATSDAPRLTLRRPPMAAPPPAPRKPEVSPEMMAEVGVTTVDEPAAALAPEFQAPASADAAPAMAEAPAVAEVETTPIEAPAEAAPPAPEPAPAMQAQAEPAPQPEAMAAPQSAPAPAATTAVASAAVPAPAMTAETPAAAAAESQGAGPVSLLPAGNGSSVAETAPAPARDTADAIPMASADVPAPVMPAPDSARSAAPPAGVQTAAVVTGVEPVEDMSFTFDADSAELSDLVQAELRSLANSLRANDEGRIQVLGFASAEGGSQDLARKLALSRALKVRTFLIDAGVPSARIQVRSLGDKSDGGPANRVDIRPIDS